MLVLLQMLKVCFPLGYPMRVPDSHANLNEQHQLASQEAVLLSRVLSLFPLGSDATRMIKVDRAQYA